jgi:hypothetical protein
VFFVAILHAVGSGGNPKPVTVDFGQIARLATLSNRSIVVQPSRPHPRARRLHHKPTLGLTVIPRR